MKFEIENDETIVTALITIQAIIAAVVVAAGVYIGITGKEIVIRWKTS